VLNRAAPTISNNQRCNGRLDKWRKLVTDEEQFGLVSVGVDKQEAALLETGNPITKHSVAVAAVGDSVTILLTILKESYELRFKRAMRPETLSSAVLDITPPKAFVPLTRMRPVHLTKAVFEISTPVAHVHTSRRVRKDALALSQSKTKEPFIRRLRRVSQFAESVFET
jgi:hypothetical protein